MANFRLVNTAIWKDPWFVDLRLTEQHLFIYLLTSGLSSLSGIYEVSIREIAFDTTIDQEEIKRIFNDRFAPDKKAFYEIGWVIIPKFLRHQHFNTNQYKAVVKMLNDLPLWLKEKIINPSDTLHIPFETVSNGLITLEKGNEPLWNIADKKREEKLKGFSSKSQKGKRSDGSPLKAAPAELEDGGNELEDWGIGGKGQQQ